MLHTVWRPAIDLPCTSVSTLTFCFGDGSGSKSQIALEVGGDEISIIGGVEIDRVGERSVLQRNRALAAKAAGHALYLLLDRILAERVVANAPDTFERSVTISCGAKLLESTGPVPRSSRISL
jgi:hypothetical protein